MAFKTVKSYNEDKFGGLFLLRNDGDFADVVFLYQGIDDVLVADTHYIKSPEYSGYVHCCGRGCPACAKNIRVQTKLFIPLYNIQAQEIQFWDRTIRFEPQLHQDVFTRFPNPSEYVFRITRHGAAGDINTTYEITAIGRNTDMSFAQLLAAHNVKFPDHYSAICRDVPATELYQMLNTTSETSDYSEMPNYQVTPRAVSSASHTEVPACNPDPQIATPVSDVDINADPSEAIEELDDDDVNF